MSAIMTSDPTRWPDLAGRIIEDATTRRHVLPLRVYFEDTDFSGLVYHASYVRWSERGRSDFLRLLGNDHRDLMSGASGREPAAFVVRRMALEYLKPARIDDILEVTTSVKETGAAHLVLDQRISRLPERGQPPGPALSEASQPVSTRGLTPPAALELFEATVTVVLVSVSGKPLRLSTALRTAFTLEPDRP